MAIKNIVTSVTGLVGVSPRVIYIDTDDTLATVTTAGYLNKAVQQGFSFNESDMACVTTKTSPSVKEVEVAWLEVSYSSPNWSLVPTGSPGEVDLPTIANYIAHFTNTTGTLSSDAANIINAGNIQAGLSGTAGTLASYPATALKGSLVLAGVANTGNTNVTISNAAHGQATVISIPDGGQATAEFIISDSAGTQNITSGALQVDAGAISSGLAAGGFAGNFVAWANTTASGNLALLAVDNASGDFDTVISNAAAIGQDQTISIPDSGAATANFILSASAAAAQSISSGLSITGNNNVQTSGGGQFLAGSSGSSGYFISYPSTAASGSLEVQAIDNASGDFDTTINNAAAVGQDQVITIPDSGAATANFLLDAGAANLLGQQEFVGIESVLTFGTGTWTVTRIAQGNYVSRHTPGDETSIIAIDLTPMIRTAASKGFRLDSFDVIYAIAADALDAHTVVLDRIEYADNVAVSVNSIAITGALATATQANPYVTNVAVDTPAFDNTADSKYVIELTVNNSATSEYDFYGIMLRFTQTVA
jgi:hypothetical protein